MADDSVARLVAERRSRAAPDLAPSGSDHVWGLALSGGGIRSATFCFGLLKSLAKNGLLPRFDLVSTVSGGGYIGATLGRLFGRCRTWEDTKTVHGAMARAESTWFMWWLRANGRYLVPSGARDTTFAIALYLRNLVGVHLELGLLAIVLAIVLALVDTAGWWAASWLGYVNPGFFTYARFLPDWLPVLWLLLPFVAFVGLVNASAYWCMPWLSKTIAANGKTRGALGLWLIAVVVAASMLLLQRQFSAVASAEGSWMRGLLLWSAVVLVASWLIAVPVARHVLVDTPATLPLRERGDRARNRLTVWLANCFRAAGLLALFGAMDRLAWFLAFETTPRTVATVGVALGIAAAALRASLPLVGESLGAQAPARLLLPVARVGGYLLAFLLCSWWISLVYLAALGATFQVGPHFRDAWLVLLAIFLPAGLYLLFTGRNFSFLNLSSLHAFYRARLARSYLGAANATRFQQPGVLGATADLPRPVPPGLAPSSVGELEPDDDVRWDEYHPYRNGGPVHLVNVCINQTRDPRGGLFNRDRRGLNLTVASGGAMRVGAQAWRPLAGDGALTLATWTAISGAAIAPGLGSLTRGGISALATFAGLRLGYWWDAATRPGAPQLQRRSLFAKSWGLLRETAGSFKGEDGPDWFLTDGGHFENTAAYALLAERAEVVIVADCGADPGYTFSDLENLVRKARIDLQASIRFLRPKSALERAGHAGVHWPATADFGSLNDLHSDTSSACLAMAEIEYFGTTPSRRGILVLVKPNVADGLPVDLVNFKAENPDFPQQSTADQFFSEAQWESYFQLGRFLGQKLELSFVRDMVSQWGDYFVSDEQSSIEAALEKPTDAQDTPPANGARNPSRIAAATVRKTLSLGAAATVAVAMYQAIDSARSARDKRVADERVALKELTELWARIPPPSQAPSAPAVSALAAAIVRTADTLCPSKEARWFQESPLALKIHTAAVEECRRFNGPNALPRSCEALLAANSNLLQSTLPNCLLVEHPAGAEPPPRYWVYDYSRLAPYANAHPCDPVAALYRYNQALYSAGRLDLTSAETGPTRLELGPGCASTKWVDAAREAAPAASEPASEPASASVSASAPISPTVALSPLPPAMSQQDLPPATPTAAASSSGAPAAPAKGMADAMAAAAAMGEICRGKTVYVQIHGPELRDEVRVYREPWRKLGASVPPIEDVLSSATSAGRSPPLMPRRPTIRVHEQASWHCAEALAKVLDGHLADTTGWSIEPLSPRLQPIPGVLEVWFPRQADMKAKGAD